MKMNKIFFGTPDFNIKRRVFFAIAAVVIFTAVIALHYEFVSFTPQRIYGDSQNSVVEFKAKTNDDTVEYGTGVIIKENGLLVTNAHLVTYKLDGNQVLHSTFSIRFSFENEYREVTLKKYSIEQDMAVLLINDTSDLSLQDFKLGDDEKIKSGNKIYAIGNGLNHGVSISEGIISLPKVNIMNEGISRMFIQCDVTINDGNSGGALLDDRGRLIGITTLRMKDKSGEPVYGMAYSIPISNIIEYINNTSE